MIEVCYIIDRYISSKYDEISCLCWMLRSFHMVILLADKIEGCLHIDEKERGKGNERGGG